MTTKQSNFISFHNFSRSSLASILRWSLKRLVLACFCFALASNIANPVLGQTLIGRNSHLNYNYIFGAGATVFQDTQELTAATLNLSDSHSLGHIQNESGVLNGNPWSAGISIDIQQQYSITGSIGLFGQIEASGSSIGETMTNGPASAGLFSSNPGNSLIFNFDLLQAQDYTLNGAVAFTGSNAGGGTRVALQRWDGIVWQSIHDSLALPGTQGDFDWSGTLNAGEYRMLSRLNVSLSGGNLSTSRSYNYDLNFTSVPEPGSASLVFFSLMGMALFRNRRQAAKRNQ